MLPSRFATNVGHRTVVCKTLDKVLGGDAVKPESRELPICCALKHRQLMFYVGTVLTHSTARFLITIVTV